VTTYLSSSQEITEPTARLNTVRQPFAIVDLGPAGHGSISVDTPSEARTLATAFEAAAVLLEEHAASRGVCPECQGAAPGHALTCPLIPAGPEHPAGPQAVTP
jgi:hypothetical protein